jgi:hypothetical protein
MAAEDSDMCAVCGPRKREQDRRGSAARNASRREAGRCIRCNAKSSTCECIDCQIKTGRISQRAIDTITAAATRRTVSRPVMATTVEKDPRYPGGRLRSRFRGVQGRRGAPDKAQVLRADFSLALASMCRAKEMLDEACGMTDPRARRQRIADAIGQAALSGRMIDEVMDRSGVSDPP